MGISFRQQVIGMKHGRSLGGWNSNKVREVRKTCGIGLWKNIKRGWGEFPHHAEVGNGSKMKFYYDLL